MVTQEPHRRKLTPEQETMEPVTSWQVLDIMQDTEEIHKNLFTRPLRTMHFLSSFLPFFFFFFFFGCTTYSMQKFPGQHAKVHVAEQWFEPQLWQCQILNLLSYQGTPKEHTVKKGIESVFQEREKNPRVTLPNIVATSQPRVATGILKWGWSELRCVEILN